MAIKHVVMSIKGLERQLNQYKSYSGKNNYCKSCFEMTYGKVKKSIQNYKDKGYEYIPSEGCENITRNGSCGC